MNTKNFDTYNPKYTKKCFDNPDSNKEELNKIYCNQQTYDKIDKSTNLYIIDDEELKSNYRYNSVQPIDFSKFL